MKIKKKLSKEQEFEIMKLVLDKMLWIGFIVSTFGLYEWYTKGWADALFPMVTGIAVLIVFVVMIVWTYEIIK